MVSKRSQRRRQKAERNKQARANQPAKTGGTTPGKPRDRSRNPLKRFDLGDLLIFGGIVILAAALYIFPPKWAKELVSNDTAPREGQTSNAADEDSENGEEAPVSVDDLYIPNEFRVEIIQELNNPEEEE